MCVTNAFHYFSVLELYQLCRTLEKDGVARNSAMISALLHIITPAGLFASSPYGESVFSFLSFCGLLLYCKSSQSRSVVGDLLLIPAGIVFGMASTVRGNGVFNGIIFAVEMLSELYHHGASAMRRCVALVIAGCCVATGVMLPQVLAYREYCQSANIVDDNRPWCDAFLPSIYAFVQRHYW